jgi:hypothetical protein
MSPFHRNTVHVRTLKSGLEPPGVSAIGDSQRLESSAFTDTELYCWRG